MGDNMFRMWSKVFKDNRLLKDTVIIQSDYDKSRTAKVLDSLNEACHYFDLQVPMWLDSTISEFQRHDKARFNADNFIEQIDFDYLEIQVIEED